jgi:hypothetical protein
MQQPAQLGLPVKKHGPFAAAVGRQRRRQRPRYRSHQTPDRRALASAPVRRSQGYPWAETTAGMICISPRHYPMMTGWLQAKQQEGRPSRNGPNIHNRYLMAADICGETGAGREGSPAARETPAMDGRVNKRATIIRHHIMKLSYYRRHCACSQAIDGRARGATLSITRYGNSPGTGRPPRGADEPACAAGLPITVMGMPFRPRAFGNCDLPGELDRLIPGACAVLRTPQFCGIKLGQWVIAARGYHPVPRWNGQSG